MAREAEHADPATEHAWYAPDTPKADCTDAVLSGEQGGFLVRDSSQGDQMVLMVRDGGSVANFAIRCEGARFRIGPVSRTPAAHQPHTSPTT